MALLTQIIESLWGMGVSEQNLQGLDVNNVKAFYAELERRGISREQADRANALAEWRPEEGQGTRQALGSLLRTMGIPQDQINEAIHSVTNPPSLQQPGGAPRTHTAADLIRAVSERFGGQVATNVAIKLKQPTAIPEGAPEWNPYRGDKPAPKTTQPGAVRPTTTGPGAGPKITTTAPFDQKSGGWRAPTPGLSTQEPESLGVSDGADGDLGAGTLGAELTAWEREGREPTPEELDDYVHAHFGYNAWFMDVPEIRNVLTQMAKEGNTDASEAQRRVSVTGWYKNTSSSARNWVARSKADPASTLSDVTEQSDYLRKFAGKLGVNVADNRLNEIAETSLKYGWSESQIQRALGMEFKFDPTSRKQGAKISEMKQLASKYMVPLGNDTIQTWGRGLLTGDYTDDEYEEYLRQSAKSLFPQLTAAIDAGHTVDDYVDPYRQVAADYLEIAPKSIDFMDPKWRAAIDQVDQKTGQRTVLSLSDWMVRIKTDKQYGYDKTRRGVAEGTALATGLLKKFGAM
jgi:hypothetical protein